jgi:hypothetical protein
VYEIEERKITKAEGNNELHKERTCKEKIGNGRGK